MKQINNGFMDYYYLNEDGTVYSAAANKIIKPTKGYSIKLYRTDKTRKSITIRELYRMIYNKLFIIDNIKNLEGQKWKIIDDTNDYYAISNKGRVKSFRKVNAIIMKPYVNQYGYERVDLKQNGSRKSKLVHRLVAQKFLPLPDRLGLQLHHKDFNKHNNAADNLIWLTPYDHKQIHLKGVKNVGS